MITVEPNKEILKVKNTMYYGFEAKQLAGMVTGCIAGILIFILIPWIYPVKCMLVVIIMILCMSAGFGEINNQSLFKFIGKILHYMSIKKPLVVKRYEIKGVKRCM